MHIKLLTVIMHTQSVALRFWFFPLEQSVETAGDCNLQGASSTEHLSSDLVRRTLTKPTRLGCQENRTAHKHHLIHPSD